MLNNINRYSLTASREGKLQTSLRGRFSTTASAGSVGLPGYNSITTLTGFGKNVQAGIVEDILGSISEHALRNLYRDIYWHDPIAGSTVDLLSNLPFDSFSLVGVSDPKILETYLKCVENLKVNSLMIGISVDYLVLGAHVSSLIYNSQKRIYDDVMPLVLDNCKLTQIPIHGVDPVIDYVFPKDTLPLLQSKDPRIIQHLKKLPLSIRQGMQKGTASLDPTSTLYLHRRCFSTHVLGVSLYRKLLPIYLLEKSMLKGTIEAASRRQRGVLHLSCLTGNTLVSTEFGLQRIDSLVPHNTKQKPFSVPISIKIKGEKGNFYFTKYWHYRGKKDTVEVSTSTGIKITCTPDHKFLVFSNNKYIWKEAQYLKGNKICRTLNGLQKILKFSEYKYEKVIDVVKAGVHPVYDITMEKGGKTRFAANGIIVKNCGDEDWEPTGDNLTDLANMFQQADSDPINAIVATRKGVDTQEIREGNNFWKYDDIFEMTSTYKFRALGVNESFVDGTANFNTVDSALSVFMDQVKQYRNYITRTLFYEKIFPNIAVANGFLKSQKYETTGVIKENYGIRESRIKRDSQGKYYATCAGDTNHSMPEIDDLTKYEMPTIEWHKQLRPQGDKDYAEMLDHLMEKGVPIPIRMLAAAGGVNLDKVLEGEGEDISTRQKIAEYQERIQETIPNQGMQYTGAGIDNNLGIGNSVKRKPFSNRLKEFAELEDYKLNKTGKPIPISRREKRSIEERLNKFLVSSLKNKEEKSLFSKSNNPYGNV